jgi:hypothetical protein
MEYLDTLLERAQDNLEKYPFDPSQYNCTQEELIASEKQTGEAIANRWIAFAKEHCKTVRKQRKELLWVCELVMAFPASSVYALPLLIAEICNLEK